MSKARWFLPDHQIWVPFEGSKYPVHAKKRGRIAVFDRQKDARLAAAAPELLEALMECRRTLQLANFSQELAVVDAAIAKATGE